MRGGGGCQGTLHFDDFGIDLDPGMRNNRAADYGKVSVNVTLTRSIKLLKRFYDIRKNKCHEPS